MQLESSSPVGVLLRQLLLEFERLSFEASCRLCTSLKVCPSAPCAQHRRPSSGVHSCYRQRQAQESQAIIPPLRQGYCEALEDPEQSEPGGTQQQGMGAEGAALPAPEAAEASAGRCTAQLLRRIGCATPCALLWFV